MRHLPLALALAAPLSAQGPVPPSTFHLVAPHSRGALLIDTTGDWKTDRVVLYDNGQRPVMQMRHVKSGVIVSYMLDDEPKYNDTTEMCRNDMLAGVMKGIAKVSEISNMASGQITLPDRQTMLTGSFFVRKQDGHEVRQQVLWGFIVAHHLCAAVHLSLAPANPGDNSSLEPVLKIVHFDPEYQPTPADIAAMARLLPPQEASLYNASAPTPLQADTTKPALPTAPQSLELALPGHPGWLAMDAPSYAITELSAKPNGKEFGIRADDASLHTEALAASMPDAQKWQRVATDQASMAYGMSGDLAHSRAINQAAIAKDPDYPLYYYNLACADAESGNATAAQQDLQQAFDRRANTLPGEHLPDPSKDDSILKLKNNKSFWAFLQTLPKS